VVRSPRRDATKFMNDYVDDVMFMYIPAELLVHLCQDTPEWKNRLTDEDKRALCPLMFEHINPYGLFPLDLDTRLILEGDAA